MLDPYRMIVVNIVSSAILGLLILFYVYIFPRKKPNYLFLLVLISLLPLISLLRRGTYESGDLSYHATAIFSMYNSFVDGNLIPRWGAELYFGYGSPYHIIMYFFPRLLIAIIHLIGIPMLESIKLFLAGTFILSGITMYFFIKEDFGKKAGFFAGVFYLFAPYHFVDMHFRVDLGEMACFALIPLSLLCSLKLFKKQNFLWIALNAVILSLLILSHQAIALIFFPFLVLYSLFLFFTNKLNKKLLFLYPFSWTIGILLSAFYWMPILLEGGRYTWTHFIFGNSGRISFQNLSDYLYSPWMGGFLFQGPTGHLSFTLGYMHWVIFAFALLLLFKKRLVENKKILLFFVISFLIFFLMMQKISSPIWEAIPLMHYAQNSSRFLLLLVFFISSIAGIVASHIKSTWIFVLICVFVILSTSLNWGNRRTIPEISSDLYFQKIMASFQSTNSVHSYDLPIWANMEKIPLTRLPIARAQIIKGQGKILEIFINTTKHEYVINTNSDSLIRENTLYFPGWMVFVDNKSVPIFYNNPAIPGVITFNVPAGLHLTRVEFKNTPIRNVGDRTSH